MGEVRVIEGADPHLEIGAIYEIFAGRKDRPLLLYGKIKGFPQKKQVPISMKRE